MFLVNVLRRPAKKRVTIEGKGVAITLYKLDEQKKVVLCRDVLEWARFFEHSSRDQRVVAQTDVNGTWVSTVFIGVDFLYGPQSSPRVFETLVRFEDNSSYRYTSTSWEEAENRHLSTVRDLAARERQG